MNNTNFTRPLIADYLKLLFKDDKFFIVLGFFALATVEIINLVKANLPWFKVSSDEFSINILKDHVPITTIGFLTVTSGFILYVSLIIPKRFNLKQIVISQAVLVIDKLFSINSVIVNLILGYGLYALISMLWNENLSNFVLVFWVLFLGAEIIVLPYLMYWGAHELSNNDSAWKSFFIFVAVLVIAAAWFFLELYLSNS